MKKKIKKPLLTLRSAPARELNLVAVTTRLLRASTAPTATSGVSTTATSRGAAVKIAARPNNIVPALTGVPGVRGLTPPRADPFKPTFDDVDRPRDSRLTGVWRCRLCVENDADMDRDADDVERESTEPVRWRERLALSCAEPKSGEVGVPGDFGSSKCELPFKGLPVPLLGIVLTSPSCH